jgi:ferritin-like metal-binding protein YciE
MSISTTKDLYLHELGDLYDAENRFLEAQQEMLPHATDSDLKSGIQKHIEETQGHIESLEKVFAALGAKPKRETCAAAEGIVAEGQKNLKETEVPALLDILIGGTAARIEHYEIVSYRGLVAGAQQMGAEDIELLLKQNLQQEEATAQRIEANTPMLIKKALRGDA